MSIGRLLKIIVGLLLVGLVVAFLVWANQVTPATQSYVDKIKHDSDFKVTETNHSIILASSQYTAQTGIVFIPAIRIDPHAYIYKLSGIVENSGVTVVITKPTFNLPPIDFRPIATFTGDVGGVDNWYVAGHSRGGTRACGYAADQSAHVKGLILLGGYCDTDVTVPILDITAENDELASDKDIQQHANHLKGDLTNVTISDAAHSSFGDYGSQSGDGDASVDSEFMRYELTDNISTWLAAH